MRNHFCFLMAAPVAQGPPKTAPEPFLGERKLPAASHKAAPVAHGNSSQSSDAAAVLEPVVRAPLLSSGGSRSPGLQKRL